MDSKARKKALGELGFDLQMFQMCEKRLTSKNGFGFFAQTDIWIDYALIEAIASRTRSLSEVLYIGQNEGDEDRKRWRDVIRADMLLEGSAVKNEWRAFVTPARIA